MTQKRATSVAFFILMLMALGHAGRGLAQEAVYRCGSQYTNDAVRAKQEKCTMLESGAVVTIPSTTPASRTMTRVGTDQATRSASTAPRKAAGATGAASTVATANSSVQQQRDQDAKAVIESELKKTEAQLVTLRKEFDQLSSQTELERKLAVKQQMARAEADIVSLKRELKQR